MIFFSILSTLKTLQSRIFNIFFDIHVSGYIKIIKNFQRRPAQTWSKRLQTEMFIISITILGYHKLLQSTTYTFYPILSTLKTAQTRIFKFIFLDSCTRVHDVLIFFQRRPAQTWSKRLPTVIFLISIIILGYYKLIQSTSDDFFSILSTLKTLQSRIFNIFF